MTNEEIYKLYRRADYDKPKLLQVLADVCCITIEQLKMIIREGDEKSDMAKWSKEQTDTYKRMTAEKASAGEIAAAMGVQKQAVYDQRVRDKKAKTIKAVYVIPDIDNIPDIDTGEDLSDINAQIATLCETPDPVQELDPIDEAAIALKAAQKPKLPSTLRQRTIFEEAHSVLWMLEATAKRRRIVTANIVIKINDERIIGEASGSGWDAVSINQKYQPAFTAPGESSVS